MALCDVLVTEASKASPSTTGLGDCRPGHRALSADFFGPMAHCGVLALPKRAMDCHLCPALNIAELGAVTCRFKGELAGCSDYSFAACSTSWPKSYLVFLAMFYLLFVVVSVPVSLDLSASDVAFRFL